MGISKRKNGLVEAQVVCAGKKYSIGFYPTEFEAQVSVATENDRVANGTSLLCDPSMLTYKAFADLVGAPHGTIKQWVGKGLPVERLGLTVRVPKERGLRWVAENRGNSVSIDRDPVVYIAQRDSDKAVKIGWTSNLYQRQRELRKQGDNVSICAALPGKKGVELALHARFAAHRIDGEWFTVARNDVIRALASTVAA